MVKCVSLINNDIVKFPLANFLNYGIMIISFYGVDELRLAYKGSRN